MSFDVAWAAGLFEGEGSITLSRGRPVVQLRNCDEEVIARFRRALRLGKVYGPYINRSAAARDGYPRKDYFAWMARGDEFRIAVEMMWPWLSRRRQLRAVEVGFCVPPFLEPPDRSAKDVPEGTFSRANSPEEAASARG